MTMAILLLNRLWLNRLDTGEAISGPSGRDRATGYSIDGSVRTYASGRRRAISIPGLKGEVSRSMVDIDYATKEKLITWLGLTVLMRDHRGNRWFGTFFDVEISEYMPVDMYSLTITLNTTTVVEGV